MEAIQNGIESVVISESVTAICDRAFEYCRWIKSFQISRSVVSIGDEAFAKCTGLESITVLESVEVIGSCAFCGCRISSIKIPMSIRSFKGNPFAKCGTLEEIDISENSNFVFVDGVLMDREMTQAIYCNPSKEGDYSIPDTATTVCEFAFGSAKT